MKKSGLIAGICFLTIAIASYGFAWGPSQEEGGCPGKRAIGPGSPHMMGPAGGAKLSDEQRQQLETLRQKFIDETAELRIQINSASEKLALLMETSKPDKQAVKKTVKEISDLQAKLDEKHIDHVLEAKQIAPEAGKRLGAQGMGMRGQCFGPGYCRK